MFLAIVVPLSVIALFTIYHLSNLPTTRESNLEAWWTVTCPGIPCAAFERSETHSRFLVIGAIIGGILSVGTYFLTLKQGDFVPYIAAQMAIIEISSLITRYVFNAWYHKTGYQAIKSLVELPTTRIKENITSVNKAYAFHRASYLLLAAAVTIAASLSTFIISKAFAA